MVLGSAPDGPCLRHRRRYMTIVICNFVAPMQHTALRLHPALAES